MTEDLEQVTRMRRAIARRQLCVAFHNALDRMASTAQDLINEFGTTYAPNIAPFMRKAKGDPYAALDEYVASQFERGCIRYAHACCAERGVAATDFGDDSIFTRHYSDAVYKIVDLLRDEHTELARAIIEIKIAPIDVASTNVLPMCASIMARERAEVEARRNQKIIQRTSSAYKCSKCGKSMVTLQEQQIRRPDEPPALVISCTYCPHSWIMK